MLDGANRELRRLQRKITRLIDAAGEKGFTVADCGQGRVQGEDFYRPEWGSAEPGSGDRRTFWLASTVALPFMAVQDNTMASNLFKHWLANSGDAVTINPAQVMNDLPKFKAKVGQEIKPGRFDSGCNVSLEKALRDHRVDIPAGAQDVQYSANSELEGYPFFLEFEAPCSEMGAFSKKNGLERLPMEKMWGTNAAVEAQESGWRHRKGDYGFRRDSGTTVTRIHALVSPRGSDCHVWVDN